MHSVAALDISCLARYPSCRAQLTSILTFSVICNFYNNSYPNPNTLSLGKRAINHNADFQTPASKLNVRKGEIADNISAQYFV